MVNEMINTVWFYPGNKGWKQEDSEKLTAWCHKNRVGKVLAHFPLHSGVRKEETSGIQSMIDSCAAHGIEVHALIRTLVQRAGSRSELLLQDPDCYCTDFHGIANWDEPQRGKLYLLDPSHPSTVPAITGACRDLMKEFRGLAGIHLDFIRYYYYKSSLAVDIRNGGHWNSLLKQGEPVRLQTADGSTATFYIEQVDKAYQDPPIGRDLVLQRTYSYCYCKRCLTLFQEKTGISIPASLRDTRTAAEWLSTHARDEWLAFRASLITGTVRAIRKALKDYSPEAQLSAAVWYNSPYGNELRDEPLNPESVYEHFGQKWGDWVQEGIIDFVCPMNYWLSPESFGRVITEQYRQTAGKVPIYAGLLRSEDYPVDLSTLSDYQRKAEEAGARGLSYFSYGGWNDLI